MLLNALFAMPCHNSRVERRGAACIYVIEVWSGEHDKRDVAHYFCSWHFIIVLCYIIERGMQLPLDISTYTLHLLS